LVIDASPIEGGAFTVPVWSGRRLWYWPLLADEPNIDEINDPFAAIPQVGEFAEDVSRILPEGLIRPFTCDFEPFSRRYISDYPAGDPRFEGTHGTGHVEYQPFVSLVTS
jgi:hypothetical protein